MKRPHLASLFVVGAGYAGLCMLLRPRGEGPYGYLNTHPTMWDLTAGTKLFDSIEPGPHPNQRGIANWLRNSVHEIAVSRNGDCVAGRAGMKGRLLLFSAATGAFLGCS